MYKNDIRRHFSKYSVMMWIGPSLVRGKDAAAMSLHHLLEMNKKTYLGFLFIDIKHLFGI